jgi:OOP family OmpA-OmpF porin
MKHFSLTLLAAAATLAALPASVFAIDAPAAGPAYVVDATGRAVTAADGSCWRNGEWTPALATAPCDPVIMPPVVAVAPVAPAPEAPAPVVARAVPVPVVVPLPTRVSFSGDALFAIDKAVLRPESRVLLDDLVHQMAGTTSDTVTVTGNTDRIGKPAYNQKLSERRANAVKDYLVSQNLQAGSIVAKGVGETQPVTTDCVGKKATRKLIACLQPDRRVDVEMTGSKPAGN